MGEPGGAVGEVSEPSGRRPKSEGGIACNARVVCVEGGRLVTSRCTARFFHYSSLSRHQAGHWGDTCIACLALVDPAKIEAHADRCQRWRRCTFCGENFTSRVRYKDHLNNRHGAEMAALIKGRTRPSLHPGRVVGAKKRVQCPDCGERFTRRDNMLKHKLHRCRLSSPTTPCSRCGALFAFRRHLAYHRRNACADDPAPDPGSEPE